MGICQRHQPKKLWLHLVRKGSHYIMSPEECQDLVNSCLIFLLLVLSELPFLSPKNRKEINPPTSSLITSMGPR